MTPNLTRMEELLAILETEVARLTELYDARSRDLIASAEREGRLREALAGVPEALDRALEQFSEPMSPLNSHELGERLAGDVAEIVRHARARHRLATHLTAEQEVGK